MTDNLHTELHDREQKMLLDSATNNAPLGIVVHDIDGIIKYWSKGAELIFLYTSEEAVGNHLGDLIFPEAITKLYAKSDFRNWKIVANKKPINFTLCNKLRTEIFVEYYGDIDESIDLVCSYYRLSN